ncbi:MAG: hypothetical protein KGL99_14625 [Burkholderiales bacterium]|nr:hypothetical protein [Burkholderiales bacterium]
MTQPQQRRNEPHHPRDAAVQVPPGEWWREHAAQRSTNAFGAPIATNNAAEVAKPSRNAVSMGP